MNKIKNLAVWTLAIVIVTTLFLGVSYSIWNVKKNFNYYFNYKSKVTEQIAPLELRIEKLEKRVSELENKKSLTIK